MATNTAKAIFVSMYLTMASVIAAYGIYMLTVVGFHPGWLGAILANGPVTLFIGWLMMFRPTARTEFRLSKILYLALLGVVAAAWQFFQVDEGAGLALILALAGLAGYLVYDYWYSIFDRSASLDLKVGAMLPEFEVADADGNAVSSTSFAGAPALLMFYRGNWCPLCMAQIKEIAGQYQELDARGVSVALISPQPPGHTKGLALKFDVPFKFLVDRKNRAAIKLGIAAPGGLPLGMQIFGYDSDTVLPTVIMTNAEGRIILADRTENYRVRPEPALFLAALDGDG